MIDSYSVGLPTYLNIWETLPLSGMGLISWGSLIPQAGHKFNKAKRYESALGEGVWFVEIEV